MQIYLDTANIGEIEEAASWGVLSGVTTNPSLMAREGGTGFEETISRITQLVDGPISAETTSEDAGGMVKEGLEYSKWHPNVIIKVPSTTEGLKACHRLKQEGIRCNVTLCFNANQALLAARAGAFIISPFIGRLDDIGEPGIDLLVEIAEIYANAPDIDTLLLAASIRHPRHIVEAAMAGADIATVPFNVLEQSMKHPLTDKGIERFLADWRQREAQIKAVASSGD